MARTISATLRSALYAEETGEVPIVLLTITHPLSASPAYVSSDPTQRITTDPLVYGTVSRGNQFLFVPFSIALPDDKNEAPPRAQIILDNVGRGFIPLLRSAVTPAKITIEVVLASSPNVVEVQVPQLDLVGADYDANSVTMTLAQYALQNEPFPADLITPSNFPGLF